jgi:tRNA U38,U39,U40 pseudouridine synthase TruA
MLKVELLQDRGVAVLTPQGKLEASDFERAGREIDPFIETHEGLNGLIVHTKNFPGWADFSTFVKHIQFIKNHHRKIRRVAIVSDGEILKIVPAIAQHFAAAELRQFPFDEIDRALAWLETGQ